MTALAKSGDNITRHSPHPGNPGVGQARSAGRLYRYYFCLGASRSRRCYDLAYHSQWEETWWRAKRRASKLWQRLGGDPDDDFIPSRPKGMHRRTYERLIAEAEQAEDLADASITASMSKRFGRRLE